MIYTKAISLWLLWEPVSVWIALVVSVVPVVYALYLHPSEPTIRIAGVILQVGGIGTVVWGVWITRKLFERPSYYARVQQWVERRPRLYREMKIAGAALNLNLAVSGSGLVTRAANPNQTLDERVAVLERELEKLREHSNKTLKEHSGHLQNLSGKIEAEEAVRSTQVAEVRTKLVDAQTGGLDITFIGAIWILLGTILGGTSSEIYMFERKYLLSPTEAIFPHAPKYVLCV